MKVRMDEERSRNEELFKKIALLEHQLKEKETQATQPPAPAEPAGRQSPQVLLEKAMERMEKMEVLLQQQSKPMPRTRSAPPSPPAAAKSKSCSASQKPDMSQDGSESGSDDESEDETTMRTPSGSIAPLHDRYICLA
jgi:hypothetical protein